MSDPFDQPTERGSYHRVTLDFSDKGSDELERIRTLAKLPDGPKTIRASLAVYKWYLDRMEAGEEILVRHPDGTTEKMLFVFPPASTPASAE